MSLDFSCFLQLCKAKQYNIISVFSHELHRLWVTLAYNKKRDVTDAFKQFGLSNEFKLSLSAATYSINIL